MAQDDIDSVCLARRSQLIWGVSATAALALAPARGFAAPKVSQASVGFLQTARGDHCCGNCKLFRDPSSCLVVNGVISKDCSCKIWLPKAV